MEKPGPGNNTVLMRTRTYMVAKVKYCRREPQATTEQEETNKPQCCGKTTLFRSRRDHLTSTAAVFLYVLKATGESDR